MGWIAVPAQETRGTVNVDDVERSFLVRLPKEHNPKRRYPILILLHHADQEGADMERLTGFDDLADKSGTPFSN